MVRQKTLMLGVSIFLVACNLRPAITSVGPLVDSIQAALSIPGYALGMITALPLLAFSLVSPAVPSIATRWGNERTIFLGLILLMTGIGIRSSGSAFALYLGTLLLGIGITAGNVLIPSVIKTRMVAHTGIMTSIFSTCLSMAAGIASGISIPLAVGLAWGWELTLLFWMIPATIAAVCWLPQLRYRNQAIQQSSSEKAVNGDLAEVNVWKSPTAWHVTLFMGFQSFLYFTLVTWLPTILQEQGVASSFAGWMVAYFQFVGLPFSLMMPILAVRLRDQRIISFLSGVSYTLGIIGILLSGDNTLFLIISVSLMGIGGSSSVSLAITFMSLRAHNGSQAAKLSGMSQSVGYLLAMLGPILLGLLADYGDIRVTGIGLMIVAGCALATFGYFSGRSRMVS